MNKVVGSAKVTLKINGQEFDFNIDKLHSEWQIRTLVRVMLRIFNKAVNLEAVKGAEEILKETD